MLSDCELWVLINQLLTYFTVFQFETLSTVLLREPLNLLIGSTN